MPRPVLDWQPPAPQRQVANQPYRMFRQLGAENPTDFNPKLFFRTRHWKRKLWLNQGQEGACTGFGSAHVLGSGYRYWPVSDAHAFRFYVWARQNDYWAGEDYDGSSCLGAARGLHKANIIKGYWHVETPEEFKAALANYGPLLCGSWWHTGMWDTDSEGLIHPTGIREGGHAYCVAAQDLKRNRVRIDNSWGPGWGVNGSALMDLDELFSLLFEQNGEVILFKKKAYNHLLLPS